MLSTGSALPASARRFAVLLAIAAAAILDGLVATAVGPMLTGAQYGGRIHGCVNISSGALRIAHSENQCASSERTLDWNQQGQPDMSDFHAVVAETVVSTEDQEDRAAVFAVCPAGYKVLGSGAGLSTSSGTEAWTMVRSEPVGPEANTVGLE
jgi:hypothetical protein